MRPKKPNVPKLREQLAVALQKEKFGEALGLYEELGLAEPADPRWPQRHGDLLRRLKQDAAAIKAYEVAVGLYAKQGFVARAAAMAKLILQIDPSRLDVLERVDPDEARRLHRQQRQMQNGQASGLGIGVATTQVADFGVGLRGELQSHITFRGLP